MSQDRMIGIGIDLGTSNCAISVVSIKSGRYEFSEARDLDGLPEIPSVVYVEEDGSRKYGNSAAPHALRLPDAERVLNNLKLLLRDNVPISLPGLSEPVTPVELIRGLLSFLKKCFSEMYREPCESVVITRPANSEFDVDYRYQIREAVLGDEPLFDSFITLEEPDAVLLSLGSLEPLIGKKVLVFDMGGGTLDITVRSVDERDGRPYLELLAIHGSDVAGRHLTEKVAYHLLDGAVTNGLFPNDLPQSEKDELLRLNFGTIDRAKCRLSSLVLQAQGADKSAKKLSETIPLLSPDPNKGRKNLKMSVSEFNKLLKDFIDEALETVKKAIATAGLLPMEIDAYYVVGGGSRIPGLTEALTDFFGRSPESLLGEYGNIDPHLAVARGAAVWALNRPADDDADLPHTGPILERRLPYAISQVVDKDSERTVAIFDEGTTLPAEFTRNLYARIEGEDSFVVKLVRGLGDPQDCVPLRDAEVKLVTRAALGAQRLEFSYRLSLDGELTLLVKDWNDLDLPVVRFDGLL